MTESQPGRAKVAIGGQDFTLHENGVYTIGSADANDVVVHHATIAPVHARLTLRAGVVTIESLVPTASTTLHGQPVTRQTMQLGETFRLGEIPLRVDWIEAATRAGALVPKALVPSRPRAEASFFEILAHELRRAPWFGISALAHVIILVLLSALASNVAVRPPPPATLGFKEMPGDPGAGAGEGEPDVTPEAEPSPDMQPANEEPTSAFRTEEAEPLPEPGGSPLDQPGYGLSGDGLFTRLGGGRRGGDDDILTRGGGALGTEGFRKTVGGMRKSGLEITFVVDSTGSMGSVLQGAKDRIAVMVDVLHALVPDARFAIITYRDQGKSEDYLLRQIPLSRDVYRAINFMQTIQAGGGGDRDEAVLEGLIAALQLRWSKDARRVIVLVGDAPPHDATESSIQSRMKAFAADGRSYMHAIVTSENGRNQLPKDTLKSFGKIASAGKGECLPFEDEEQILRQVLSLAFGHEYRQAIDEVYKIVAERNAKVATWALDLVQRSDFVALDQQLAKDPVSDEVVKALLRTSKPELVLHLIDLLASTTMPERGRHAASYVVQQLMHLSRAPLDAERGGVLDEATRRGLREKAKLGF